MKSQEAGFSLLEIMIVLVVLLIITGAIFGNLVNSQKSFDAEQANAEATANARFAINRLREVLESSGNNPSQVANINDQTGGIVNMFSSLNTTPYTTSSGISGTTVNLSANGNCTGGTATQYCGVAVDLRSDLNGDGDTLDDITATSSTGSSIFSQNIVTSEHVQIYLDTTSQSNGLAADTVYLVNLNAANNAKFALAEFVVDINFMLDISQSNITVTVTARSNRAVAIESNAERRFRFATLTSVIRIRNMNNNVAKLLRSLSKPSSTQQLRASKES